MNCGPNNVNGNSNTFTGVMAGNNCSTGDQNSFYGVWAGLQTNAGSGNVAMGFRTNRFNHGGNNNTFVGTDAGVPGAAIFWGLTNANGFGSNAIARSSNTMILGDNSVNVGIGLSSDVFANGPTNKLEIDAGLSANPLSPTDPSPNGLPGQSGLTFRDLHLGNTASPANGFALSVDNSGEVILVPAGGIGGFGFCSSPLPLLTGSSGLDLNNFNLHFSGQQAGDHVGIGTNCTSFLFGKLTVSENSGLPGTLIGTLITNANDAVGGNNIGLLSRSFQTSPVPAGGLSYTAGFFVATGSKNCFGVDAIANGTAINGAINYGGRFTTQNGFSNYGIYASAPAGAGQIPNGPPVGLNFAGYFNGDVVRIGTDNFTSDVTLKQNIDSISGALSIIDALLPKTFFYDTLAHTNMSLSRKKQYGFIAQDVEILLPELVGSAIHPATTDSLGNVIIPALTYKTLNYNAFIAILMKGMQEQQQQIDSLSAQINSCCNSSARTQNPNINQTDVTLSNSESIVLNQNIPNPYAEQTTITYYLPESVQKAQLLFYDATGKLIKAVELTARGNGQINVFANDLSNGIYSYALVVDGQIADTKRMVKTQ